ncbi:MAG: type II toxin-antitoxin system RelE/ParE family toxin [Mariprofundales bacterium]|nr:type II toxin-antitoxin system RelE/ParE family toxin [Mariprofundales bacterium]
MIEIKKSAMFQKYMGSLRDQRAKAKIMIRLDRLASGHFGDAEPVGDGISELRIHYGPGYRVYVQSRGEVLIVVLCAGNKSSQQRDIEKAKALAKEIQT